MAKKGQLTTAEPLKFEEYKTLLRELHHDKKYKWELYFIISFCLACRASDILSLKWNDILGRDECVVHEKKTGKTRCIPINQDNKAIIQSLYKLMGSPAVDGWIWPSTCTEGHVSIQAMNKMLKRIKETYNINIDHFSTHSLRKTFGRYVYDSMGHTEESLLVLNTILKHASLNTTKVYLGITKDETDSIFSGIKI